MWKHFIRKKYKVGDSSWGDQLSRYLTGPEVGMKAFNGFETMGEKWENSFDVRGPLNTTWEVFWRTLLPLVFSSLAHDLCAKSSQYPAVIKNGNCNFESGSNLKVWTNMVKRWNNSNSKLLALKINIILERWDKHKRKWSWQLNPHN